MLKCGIRQYAFDGYLFLYLCVALFCILILNIYDGNISDKAFSILYVIVQLVSLRISWKYSNRKLSLFVLFQLTFMLFIGGRFVSCLLGNINDVFQSTFFYGYIVSDKRKMEIFTYVILFVILSCFGYCMGRINTKIKPCFLLSINENNFAYVLRLANTLFPLFCVYVLYSTLEMLIAAFSGGGYLILYDTQTQDYSAGGKLIPNLMLALFSISFICGKKVLYTKYLLLYLVNSFMMLLIGTRAAIGALFLFLIWIYSLNHKVDFKKLIAISLLALISLLYLFTFSVRTSEIDFVFSWSNLFDIISDFFYKNGHSLMVFDASRLLDNYPIPGYIQTFIPGTSFVWSLLFGVSSPEELSFTYYLCNELNPNLFSAGYGLGWSVMSDIYLFSFNGIYFLFAFITFLLGYFCGILENLSERYSFYRYILIYIFTTVLILPRALLATTLNMVLYGIIYLYILYYLFSRRKNCI